MPPDDTDDRPAGRSRRGFLRAGAVAALASSTAGCIATLPPLGRRIRYGRVDAPAPGPPDDRRWLPAPSAFRATDAGDWSDDVVTPVAFSPGGLGGEVVGERFDLFAPYVTSQLDYAGVDLDGADRAVWFGPAFVVSGAVDRDAARRVLDGTGYEPVGTHHGWDLYGRDDLYRALGVGDPGVVVVPWQEDLAAPLAAGLADVRAVVDAVEGATPRFHEGDGTFRRLSAAVGTSPQTWYTGGFDDGQVAGASSFRFDASAVYYVWHWLYPEGETPSEAGVQRRLREYRQPAMDPREAMDVDVTVDGRVATIEQRRSHRRFRESNEERPRPPLATWGVDHDRAAETMTLRLEAGASIPAADLKIDYHPAGPSAEPAAQFADRYDTVTAGDAVTVDLSDRPYRNENPDTALVLSYEPDAPLTVTRLVRYPFEAAVHGEDAAANGRAVQAPDGRRGDRE